MSGTTAETGPVLEPYLKRFGLERFRPGQRKVIDSVFAGRDSLCIMPTGGGKSLCYQLPAIAREGMVLVVSPLIALMKDQVDALQDRGIAADCIHSGQTSDQQSDVLRKLARHEYDLLYVAPERLRSGRFLEIIQQVPVQLLAVDEAHCISQWGHDFRPDYARLGRLRQRIGSPQTIALTATATRDVQSDIIAQLNLNDPDVFITGFARKNLSLAVQQPANLAEKDRLLLDFLRKNPGSGIIYASTRKRCEEIVPLVSGDSRRFGFYHGGMPPEDRVRIQNAFMEGKIDVIIATNAFGMGIDKPDLRFVVHYNIPGTLEAYYQEAGRAGRDGKPSRCLLLYSYSDRFIQEFFIENSYPSREAVRKVYEYLRSLNADPIELTQGDLKEILALDIANEGVGVCEQLLEKAGALERLDSTQNLASVRLTGQLDSFVDLLPRDARVRRKVLRRIEELVGDVRDERVYFHPKQIVDDKVSLESVQRAIRQLNEMEFFDYVPPFRGRAIHLTDRTRPFESWAIDFAQMEKRKSLEYEKLNAVVGFAQSTQCRQLQILEYFGDSERDACRNCDNCGIEPTAGEETTASSSGIPPRFLPAIYTCVRITLSGVARNRGRFGRSMVCQMLAGSNSARLRKSALRNLSTFGLLKFLNQSEIETILDRLMSFNLVHQTEKVRFRPTVEISESGKALMLGKRPLPPGFEIPTELASKIAANFPDAEADATVSGPDADPVTDPVSTRNGATVDATDQDSDDGTDQACRESESEPTHDIQEDRPGTIEDWQWTMQLLDAGFDGDEILKIRRMGVGEFLSHLEAALESGAQYDFQRVFCLQEGVQQNESEATNWIPGWVDHENTENAVRLCRKIGKKFRNPG